MIISITNAPKKTRVKIFDDLTINYDLNDKIRITKASIKLREAKNSVARINKKKKLLNPCLCLMRIAIAIASGNLEKASRETQTLSIENKHSCKILLDSHKSR